MSCNTIGMQPETYKTNKEYCLHIKANGWACMGVSCADCMFGVKHPGDDIFELWNRQNFMDYRITTIIDNPQGLTVETHTKWDNFPDMVLFWDAVMAMGDYLKPGHRGTVMMYHKSKCIHNIKIGPTK